jgi:hypothetical protein
MAGPAPYRDTRHVIDDELTGLATRLTAVPGIVAVLLGGSRARGEHAPESDVDLGLYYRPPLDTAALAGLARTVSGPHAQVTEPGEWGPWVDGGGWLTIGGTAVDWIYRDADRVHRSWQNALHGQYTFHAQIGHPLGVPDFAYAGELALGIVLSDPTGEIGALQQATREYPAALSDALASGLWEASFLLEGARKALSREDTSYVAGCLFRVVQLCAQALHGHNRRWSINEKGAVASAGALPQAPTDFTGRAQALLGGLGTSTRQLTEAVEAGERLVADTTAVCRSQRRPAPEGGSPVR